MTDSHADNQGSAQLINYQDWVGREEKRTDRLDLRIAQLMAATFDMDPQSFVLGTELPTLWHWAFFVPDTPTSQLGNDGHPRRGGFLPPVTLPNRMWAGGRVVFHKPLRVGEDVRKTSRILRCETKQGRSGPLVFVTVKHRIENSAGEAIVEEQDLVYRHPAPKGASPKPHPAPSHADVRVNTTTSAALLFRYSALTFNTHRIHYDHLFVTQQEGYPGLIVHGPLLATMLANVAAKACPGKALTSFEYRALEPLFVGQAFELCAAREDNRTVEVWTQREKRVTMRATTTFAE